MSSKPVNAGSPPLSLPAAGEARVSRRRYAGASADERQSARRERLLEAGFDVFGQRGYREATMRMICSQARLADRYFYEHFTSVDDVFLEVHKRLSYDAAKAIAAGAASTAGSDDPVALVGGGLRGFYEFIKSDPRRAQILLNDAVTAGLTSPLNINAWVSRYVDFLRLRIQQRYPRLSITVDLQLVIGGFVGMVIHTSSVWVQRGFDTPIDQLVDHTVYAWAGLHAWLAKHNPPAPPAA